MLISKAPDEEDDTAEGYASPAEDDSHEYQTANDLFELMAKNSNITSNDGGTLSPRDLVLLYKNIDRGTKLMSNRRVETIVYSDDPESDGSELSEVYSNEDLHNVILINKEQIDFINSNSSVDNKLCHKFGDFELQTSGDTEYDRQFLFKDPYVKEQLRSINLFSNSTGVDSSVLPSSLLDYVCCKRLEDNYNFYMDNIIRYVKNTIDQLKRISNGDYLTDRVKEKWREVERAEDVARNNTKVLATSTSIPLHVECKIGGLKSTWDDIVHSAVDVRSLSKILEKKIIVEIPKLINGSFTLLSKCCADNLVISCKQDCEQAEDAKKSRVDVVLQLKRSETGHVVSNISSIMILQTTPAVQELHETAAPLPLVYKKIEEVPNDYNEDSINIMELDKSIKEFNEVLETSIVDDDETYEEDSDSYGFQRLDNPCNTSLNSSSQDDLTESSCTFNTSLDGVKRHTQKEASFDVCPDDLRMTIQRLAAQSALLEESVEDISQPTQGKRRSPTRVRIKSPYENQSYILEEKKRRKLLEIRERRERKKMALAESCKITKHKYGKGAVMPQASSSVTKLSITNKSFYNSIYGHVDNKVDIKQTTTRNRRKDIPKEVMQEALENFTSPQDKSVLPAANAKKFINRSYDLDDTVSEMMYMKMKRQERDETSGSTSAVSSDFRGHFNMFSSLMSSHECDVDEHEEKPLTPTTPKHLLIGPSDSEDNEQKQPKELTASQSVLNIVPANTPKANKTSSDKNDLKKVTPSLECRKSIDKIYELVKKLGKNQTSTSSSSPGNIAAKRGLFCLQVSDSESLRPIPSPSSPSSFSKNISTDAADIFDKKPDSPTTITKVIINSKSQIPIPKTDTSKNKDRKRSGGSPTSKQPDNNPLKAISQLLHEFDNVQRKRLKSGTEHRPKSVKKTDATIDGKSIPSYKKRSRFVEQQGDFTDRYSSRASSSKDKRTKVVAGLDGTKIPYQQVPVEEKYVDKSGKKKVTDISDEVKEARGEAVRGPSKFTSRLNSLAQPKRTYVQAHSEEYQTRYGRNLITDRLQRLASTTSPLTTERGSRVANNRNRIKRTGNETDYMSLKPTVPSGLPIERPVKPKSSRLNSPVLRAAASAGGGPTYIHVPLEKPETLKKKMVAVESYVKNHYGHHSTNDVRALQKSRTPILPIDIDIALTPSSTLLESGEAGSNLHRMIEAMMSNTSHGLDVLTEGLETNSRSSRDNTEVFNTPKCDEGISIDSDFTSCTTTESTSISRKDNDNENENNEKLHSPIREGGYKNNNLQPFKSVSTLEKQLSLGAFSTRLKINNFKVTPKHSIQKLFLLQSGDTGPLVVKTSVSQTDKLLQLKRMPVLSKTHWNLRLPTIPMQITTVGYAFPEYKSGSTGPSNRLVGEIPKSAHKSTLICHKEGANKPLAIDEFLAEHDGCKNKAIVSRIEQAAQGDVLNPTVKLENNKIEIACYSNNGVANCVSVQAITDGEEIKHNSNETKITQTVASSEKITSDCQTPEEVDYTTSLDILVGLLNEIQKITTCQTHITNNETDECKELEMLLNKAATLDNSIEVSSPYNNVSISSIDKLRCLESNPSLYSFYISDADETHKNKNLNISPWYETKNNTFHTTIYVDKEVNVDIATKEYVNTLTDVPSIFFPVTINHSTNITNTLVEKFCQSSLQSLKLSYTDCHETYSTALSIESTHSDDSSRKIVELLPKVKQVKGADKYSKGHENFKETNQRKLQTRQKKSMVKETSCKNNDRMPKNNYCMKKSNFDPVMKLKRDILVTVYSMLVLAVFAALSFPEVLYHVV